MVLTASKAIGQSSPSKQKLSTFAYSDVKLLDGPLRRQYDWTHRLFLKLDDDRLLKVYRKRAGLPAPGEDMGGWYEPDGLTPDVWVNTSRRWHVSAARPKMLRPRQGGPAGARAC